MQLLNIPTENFGLIQCAAPDAAQFLQGQLTCDIKALKSGVASLGACCSPQGRSVAFFHIFFSETDNKAENFFLLLPLSNLENCFNHLKKFSVFSKVTLSDATSRLNETVLALLYGTNQELVDSLSTKDIDQNKFIFFHDQVLGDFLPVLCLSCNPEQIQNKNITLTQGTFLDWKRHWLAKGFIWPSKETSGQYIPQDIGFDLLHGVSFNKGCYTGQEPIARLHFKGTPKFGLYHIYWDQTMASPQTVNPESLEIYSALLNNASHQDASTPTQLSEYKKVGKILDFCSFNDNAGAQAVKYHGIARIRLDAEPLSQTLYLGSSKVPVKIEKIAYT